MSTDTEILQFLHHHPSSSRAEITAALRDAPSDSTMKRLLAMQVEKGMILCIGRGRSVKYILSPQAKVTMPLDVTTYFEQDIDAREVQTSFDFELIRYTLPAVEIFTQEEITELNAGQQLFESHTNGMTELEYRKEMERLGIDLSWKSSQIEGNTYSLLETERLLKEKRKFS